MSQCYQNGALIPNSTQVPDLILDRWMALLSGAEFKVAMYVVRRTYGFRRASDDISLAQMATGIITKKDNRRLDAGTGLNKDTVTKAVATLIDKGILIRTRHTDDRGRDLPSTYSINLSSDFGREGENSLTRVGKSDPSLPAAEKPDTGESENPTPPTEKSDPYESENPYPTLSDFPTHNRQGLDRQSEKQLDIQKTTTIPVPAPEPTVVVSLEKEMEGEMGSTLHLVAEIVTSTRTALSIIRECSEATARQQALWWPARQVTAKDAGAYFRTACRNNWPAPESVEANGIRKNRPKPPTAAETAATSLICPPAAPIAKASSVDRTHLDSIFDVMSHCAQERLDTEATDRACAATPFLADRIRLAAKGKKMAGGAPQTALDRAKYALLAEREAAAVSVGGKTYYDLDDARAAQIDADFR